MRQGGVSVRFINFLIKPASSACNLRCRYCFYEDIAENRQVKNMGIMQADTVSLLLDQAFELVSPGGAVHFAFQGGEPTVAGLSYFRNFTEQVRAMCPKGVGVSYAIQTNGTLLDEEWALFLQEHDFLVGLSLDGYKELHNRNRVDGRGADTWNTVCRAFRLLAKHRVRTNILCVVTKQCASHPDKVYNELKKLGVQYMQFIPCLDPMEEERGGQPFSLTSSLYGDFLCRLFDLWYRDWETGQYRSVRLFEDYINMMLGETSITCSTCGYCGGYYVVEGDGSVYPCDFFVLDQWRMGSVHETTLREMANTEQAKGFLLWGQEKPPECLSCRWRGLCNGGCKNDWQVSEGIPHNYFCEAFRRFFGHAGERLSYIAELERQERMKAGQERR